MSYIFSENYIKQKLRRLEEINEYNRAKLAMFSRKKAFMSKKEYERYKKILFGTDYKSERESLQNSQNQENVVGLAGNGLNKQSEQRSKKQSSTQRASKSKGKTKSMTQTAGNIISSANNKNRTTQNNGIQQGNFTGGFQQRNNQNANQNYLNNDQFINVQQQFVDQRYATPKQESHDEHGNSSQEGDIPINLQNNYNMVTFNSAGQKMNTFNPSATNQDSILYQTQNYEELDFEQQQLIKNIKKIEMEKSELESELYELQLKAANLNSKSNRKNQKSIFEDVFKEQDEFNLVESKSLLNLRKTSPRQSPVKLQQSQKGSLESLYKVPNYRQLQKKIGLDFETQWDMLEKWESVNQKYPITPNPFYSTAPVSRSEDIFLQEQVKGTFWDSINQMKKEKQDQGQQKKAVHSYLPQEENWETKFNKIGKSSEERYTMVDNDIQFGNEFIGRKHSNPSVGKYVVNKYTIDKLSDDIDMLMRQSRLNNSPFKSLKSQSPFKNKRSLFEIPEEYSQDNSVNY